MKKKQSSTDAKQLTAEEVDVFEKVLSQLKGLHSEIAELSKKAQNDALNKLVNSTCKCNFELGQ